MHRTSLVLCLLFCRSAVAADYTVEVGSFEQRAEAEAVQVGGGTPTVVRRYVDAMGWRYVVVVEGLRGLDAANEAAAAARRAGHAAEVIEISEGVSTPQQAPPSEKASAAPVASPPAQAAPAVDKALPDANAVLLASAKAHGGRKGLGPLLQSADAVELVVLRTVKAASGDLVFRSRYLRQGDARRVEVSAVAGRGANSVTVVPALGLPSMTVEGVLTPIDPARAQQSVELFAPEAVLGGVLVLPGELMNWSSAEGILTVSAGAGLERGQLVLSRTGPAGAALAEGVTRAAFGLNDSLFRSITWATPEGEVNWRFENYKKVGDVSVPHSVVILRDGREVERAEIERLELAPVVGASELLTPVPGG